MSCLTRSAQSGTLNCRRSRPSLKRSPAEADRSDSTPVDHRPTERNSFAAGRKNPRGCIVRPGGQKNSK